MGLKALWGTAGTFFSAFKGPCLALGISAFVIGSASGGWAAFKVTRAFDRSAIAEAKKELADWKAAQVQERLDAAKRNEKIMADAKAVHDEQMDAINNVAADLQRLSAGVRVCTAQSTMRVSAAPAGPAKPTESGEPRPADVVLQELAAEFARRADTNAEAYNSLIQRWKDIAK